MRACAVKTGIFSKNEIFLLDKSFSLIFGPIDSLSSIVWSERYFESGTFTLHFPREMIGSFAGAAYVADGEKCGRIEYLVTDEDGGCELGGHLLEVLLSDRRMVGKGSYSGTVTEAVTAAVEANLRELGVVVGESVDIADNVTLPYEWDDLSEWVYSVLKPYGASYRITLDWQTMKPVFAVVKGADRSSESLSDTSADTQPAIFSASFGNIVSISLEQDSADYKNVAYVEGSDGTVAAVDNSGGGERREIYKKASDIAPSKFQNTAAYEAALRTRGAETLAKYPKGLFVSAETDIDALPRYGTDYSLGDICDVVDEDLGLSYALRLTAVDTVYENGLCLICPSFGEEISRIKRVMAK